MQPTFAPQFCYPKPLGVLPFQRTAAAIVRGLARRNWSVPGVQVEFSTYGTGQINDRYVSAVRANDTVVEFTSDGRVNRVVMPGWDLLIWWDTLGLQFSVYIGSSWEADKETFIGDTWKFGRRDFDSLEFVTYKGVCLCRNTYDAVFSGFERLVDFVTTGASPFAGPHTHPGRVSPLLVPRERNELPPGYRPAPHYNTREVMARLHQALKDNILRLVKAAPRTPRRQDVFRKRTPFPADFGPLFCYGTQEDAARILRGQCNPRAVRLYERYGLAARAHHAYTWVGDCGNGYASMHAAVYLMRWCGLGPVAPDTPLTDLTIPGQQAYNTDRYVIAIQPNRADGIYVMDQAMYDGLIGPEATPAHVRAAERARGRTFVPVTEYSGGYHRPVVVIARELDLDEVQVVSGPWPTQRDLDATRRRRRWRSLVA
jgi:hypothetical protein